MLTEDNKQKFLEACYVAGVEWANKTHKAAPRTKLEDGLNQEFWSGPEADDYVVLYDVGRRFDVDFFNAVYTLRCEAFHSLYTGCINRWGEIFGQSKKAPAPKIDQPVTKQQAQVVPEPAQAAEIPALLPNRVFRSGTKIILNRKNS